jgi:SAM-dependent methyltransferase
MQSESLLALRKRFICSPEFAAKGLLMAQPLPQKQLYPLPLDLANIEVDTDATDDQLNACIAKIKAAWAHLGVVRPHFSVLTDPQFLPENIGGSIDNFWASGETEADRIEHILDRHNCSLLSTKTCVEYGSGVGRVTMGLARRFARVHGYDISPSHLSCAEQRAQETDTTNVTFHLCSETFFEPLEKCDVFYSCIVFQHNPPPIIKHLIKNALQALKLDGIAIFQVPTYIVGYRFNTLEWLGTDHVLDMQMHCLPQQKIFEIIAEENCAPLEVREDNSTGALDKFISNTFVVRKRS